MSQPVSKDPDKSKDSDQLAQLTFKIQLKRNFRRNRNKVKWFQVRRKIVKFRRVAKRIANYSIHNRKSKITSATVKHLGKLPSTIANQVIRKYKNNPECQKVSKVNLIVPACSTVKYPSVVHDQTQGTLNIKPLKLKLRWTCPVVYQKINQIELNKDYCFVTVSVTMVEKRKYQKAVGADMNIKGNLSTVADPVTKEYEFLGKGALYQRVKYKMMRRHYQKQGRLLRVKQMGDKEKRITQDINHKLSKRILDFASAREANLKIEDLTGIRKTKCTKSFRGFLNSWPFYQIRLQLEYKSEIRYGNRCSTVCPKYTTKECSNCHAINNVAGKRYVCRKCGLKIHRDVNAGFNIATRPDSDEVLSDVSDHESDDESINKTSDESPQKKIVV